MADSADDADSDSGFSASSAPDAPAGGDIDYESGTAPVPDSADWPSISDAPLREQVDAARNTWQFTPDEINCEIGRLRPLFRAAGFSDQETDDYYGIERFDWPGAAQQLTDAAGKAQDGIADPQPLIDDIKKNFPDPQAPRQPDDSGFDWQGFMTQPLLLARKVAVTNAATTIAEVALAAFDLPAAVPVAVGGAGLAVARALARRQLVNCYQAGDCGDPDSFRNQMLIAVADSSFLPKAADNWIDNAVQGVMPNPWTRSRLSDNPGIPSIGQMPPKQGAAVLWALHDKEMPASQDFYNAAIVAWAHAQKSGNPQTAGSPRAAPDYSALGNLVGNFQDMYGDYGLMPSPLLDEVQRNPELLRAMMSPEGIALYLGHRLQGNPEMDTIGSPYGEKFHDAPTLIMGIAAGGVLSGGDGSEEEDNGDDGNATSSQDNNQSTNDADIGTSEDETLNETAKPGEVYKDDDASLQSPDTVGPRKTPALPERIGPGPYAKNAIPGGPDRYPTSGQQEQIDLEGYLNGCHRCGIKIPGTKSGSFIGDHQNPWSLLQDGDSWVFYPHCTKCSSQQGGYVKAFNALQKADDEE